MIEQIRAAAVRVGDRLWDQHRRDFFEVTTITEHPVLRDFHGPRATLIRSCVSHRRNTLVRVQRKEGR